MQFTSHNGFPAAVVGYFFATIYGNLSRRRSIWCSGAVSGARAFRHSALAPATRSRWSGQACASCLLNARPSQWSQGRALALCLLPCSVGALMRSPRLVCGRPFLWGRTKEAPAISLLFCAPAGGGGRAPFLPPAPAPGAPALVGHSYLAPLPRRFSRALGGFFVTNSFKFSILIQKIHLPAPLFFSLVCYLTLFLLKNIMLNRNFLCSIVM